MGNVPQLLVDGGVEFRMVVAVQIGPDGGIGIEIFAAMNIFDDCAFAADDDNWFGLEPIAHLREGMPDEAVIELGELVQGGH